MAVVLMTPSTFMSVASTTEFMRPVFFAWRDLLFTFNDRVGYGGPHEALRNFTNPGLVGTSSGHHNRRPWLGLGSNRGFEYFSLEHRPIHELVLLIVVYRLRDTYTLQR